MSAATPGSALVSLRLANLEPGSLITLRSYADPSDSNVGDIHVTDTSDHAVALEPIAARSPARAAFRAPASGTATVRYSIRLAGRRGDMNKGFIHLRDATLNEQFGVVRGSDLFLLPDPPDAVREAKITFDLPNGWRAVAPWIADREAESGSVIGRSGRDELEETIVAPIAFGRFAAERLPVQGSKVSMFVEASVPAGARAALARDVTAATNSVRDDLPRALGVSYRIVVLPRTPEGDEVTGDGSSNGQMGTLYPLTTERLRLFARRVADGGLIHSPRGITFAGPKDGWVPFGLRERLAFNAVAEVRGISPSEVDRHLSIGYASLPGNRLDLLDLERVIGEGAGSPLEQTLVASSAAPLAIRALEDVAGRDAMRAWLRRASQKGRVSSFWNEIPIPDRERVRLRAAWAKGGEKLPVSFGRERSSIVVTKPADAGDVARRIRVVSTSQAMGYLENCGCKMSQNGGLARRQSLLRKLRAQPEPVLVLDVGSGLADPYLHADPDAFGFGEEATYQSIVGRMGYTAFGLGHAELARGVSRFNAIEQAVSVPYVSCNVTRRDGTPFAPAIRTTNVGGIRCHVTSAYVPWSTFRRGSRVDEALDSLLIHDPVASVQAAVRNLPQEDFVIVTGEMPYRVIAAIAAACPNVDLILACPQLFLGEMAPENRSGTTQNDYSGFLSRTVVAYSDMGSYGVSAVSVGLDANGRPASADFETYELSDKIPQDAGVRAALDTFYANLSTDVADVANVPTPAAVFGAAPGGVGGWVGSAACAGCHEDEAAQWRQTPHATAMRTLTAAHRDRQPLCVSCHVVGFGTADGYKISANSSALAGVQCESCHGPGRAHAADPSNANIVRVVPERVCVTCHDAEHSDEFIYSERLPHVVHEQRRASGASEEARPDH